MRDAQCSIKAPGVNKGNNIFPTIFPQEVLNQNTKNWWCKKLAKKQHQNKEISIRKRFDCLCCDINVTCTDQMVVVKNREYKEECLQDFTTMVTEGVPDADPFLWTSIHPSPTWLRHSLPRRQAYFRGFQRSRSVNFNLIVRLGSAMSYKDVLSSFIGSNFLFIEN